MNSKSKKPKKGQLHPCKCSGYNGGQCYNCLNGAHKICTAEPLCGKRNSNQVGLIIAVRNRKP